MTESKPYLVRKHQQGQHSFRFVHPLGEGGSEIVMTLLGRPAGLKRLGVNLGRVRPGKEGFVYHRHHAEEEWVYILEGMARCDVEDEIFEVGEGDFVAFPPGHGHTMKNIGESDLVYLMGGEQTPVEVADFPRHGKRMLRAGERSEITEAENCQAFYPDIEPLAPGKD